VVPPPIQTLKGLDRVVHEAVSLSDNDGNVGKRIQRREVMVCDWNFGRGKM
jgi:hypothetical protein